MQKSFKKKKDMKSYHFLIAAALLATSCKQASNHNGDDSQSETEATLQTDSTEIVSFLKSAYDDVLNAYNKQSEGNPDVEAFDKKYLSPDFLMWQGELEKMAKKYPGEIVGPDGDHWIQAQDWDQVSMRVDSVSTSKGQPTAAITITHSGNCSGQEHITLALCKDVEGCWHIDDFISLSSEKDAIKACVAEDQTMELYAKLIDECKTQRQTRDYTSLDKFNKVPYVTEKYYRLYQQVDSMDKANRAEGLSFFNSDHWGLRQEFHSIDSATVSKCEIMEDGRAIIALDLVVRADYVRKPETYHEPQCMILKWEEGQWRVDDFMQGSTKEKGLSEKDLMLEHLKGED